MTGTIELGKLSLRDALDLAIEIEDQARERYHELAAQLVEHHTEEAAEFFTSMAGNETRHCDVLRQRRREIFGDQPVTVDVSALPEIEAPEYGEVRAFMTVHQALRIALASEVRAHAFFAEALAVVRDPAVRELFSELRAEEVKHQQLVQREIARRPMEDRMDPEDYVDEPVAQ